MKRVGTKRLAGVTVAVGTGRFAMAEELAPLLLLPFIFVKVFTCNGMNGIMGLGTSETELFKPKPLDDGRTLPLGANTEWE